MMGLTVYDNFHFFHIWEWHIIFCTAFVFSSLVPCNSINVQILSIFKWLCYTGKKKKSTACLIVAAWGFIQVKQQSHVFMLDIAEKTIPDETGELLNLLFSYVQRWSQRKKQKLNKGYCNNCFLRTGYTCVLFNWLWSPNLLTLQIKLCTFL